jgi:hypothetical protein
MPVSSAACRTVHTCALSAAETQLLSELISARATPPNRRLRALASGGHVAALNAPIVQFGVRDFRLRGLPAGTCFGGSAAPVVGETSHGREVPGGWATDPAVVRRLVGHEHADLQRGLRGCRERVGKCADVPELAEAHTQRRGTGVDGEPREA